MKQLIISIIFTTILFADVIVVDQSGSGDYTTISDAVSNASSGDTIEVHSGLYIEDFDVSNFTSLTINGAGSSSTTIYTSNYAIESNNSTLTLSGLKIWSTSGTALDAREGGNLTVTNCLIISDGFYVVRINYLDTATFSDCTMEGNLDDNMFVTGTNLNVINSTISSGTKGIYANNSSALNIINSTIYNSNFAGIYTSDGSTADITNSIIRNTGGDGGGGIYVSSGSGAVTITNTLIFKATHYAVRAYENVDIQNSIIYDAPVGLYRSEGENGYGDILSAFNCFYLVTDPYGSDEGENYPTGFDDLINTDPEFVDIDADNNLLTDLTLQSTSPCIDAGNYSPVYNDLDGSRNDMGIYGGPYSWVATISATVTDLQISPSTVEQGQTITIQATGTVE